MSKNLILKIVELAVKSNVGVSFRLERVFFRSLIGERTFEIEAQCDDSESIETNIAIASTAIAHLNLQIDRYKEEFRTK